MNCRSPSDLIGRVFLTKPDPRGNRHRARIIKIVKEHEDEVNINQNPISTKFSIQMENGPGTEEIEDIMAYKDIPNHVKREDNTDDGVKWKFREILCHQHTPVGHQDRINSDYNLMISWETGAVTTKSVDDLSKDFSVNLALYAKRNNLLEEPC